jgi:hypothetical protein
MFTLLAEGPVDTIPPPKLHPQLQKISPGKVTAAFHATLVAAQIYILKTIPKMFLECIYNRISILNVFIFDMLTILEG